MRGKDVASFRSVSRARLTVSRMPCRLRVSGGWLPTDRTVSWVLVAAWLETGPGHSSSRSIGDADAAVFHNGHVRNLRWVMLGVIQEAARPPATPTSFENRSTARLGAEPITDRRPVAQPLRTNHHLPPIVGCLSPPTRSWRGARERRPCSYLRVWPSASLSIAVAARRSLVACCLAEPTHSAYSRWWV